MNSGTSHSVSSSPVRRYFKPDLMDENIDWRVLLARGVCRTVPTHTEYVPGHNELVFVESGCMLLHTHACDGRRVLYTIGRNSIANAGVAATGSNHDITLHAKTESRFFCFDAYTIYDYAFIEEYPELLVSLMRSMAKTTALLTYRTYDRYFRSSMAKVCMFLDSFTEEEQAGRQYLKGISHKDIGALAGLHPVTVSKTLTALREQGVIGRVTTSYIEVFDAAKLHALKEMPAEGRNV